MKLRSFTLAILVLTLCGMTRIEAQVRSQAAAGGGGGLCDERCVWISNPFGSGWGCRTMPGLGEGWSCAATTDVCMILIPMAGCPFALVEPVFRTGEQFVQFCTPKSHPPGESGQVET